MQNLRLLSFPKFLDHKLASGTSEPITASKLEYLFAGNGVFVRARRREFSVSLPVAACRIQGLPLISGEIVWHKPEIPSRIWLEILENARADSDQGVFREQVYLICWHDELRSWIWRKAGRERGYAFTIADDRLPEYSEACLEVHTHPAGAENFSTADDRDEEGKFRIFGIIVNPAGGIPKIRFRCGVYDHFIEIPGKLVSQLPSCFADLNSPLLERGGEEI